MADELNFWTVLLGRNPIKQLLYQPVLAKPLSTMAVGVGLCWTVGRIWG